MPFDTEDVESYHLLHAITREEYTRKRVAIEGNELICRGPDVHPNTDYIFRITFKGKSFVDQKLRSDEDGRIRIAENATEE